MALAVAAAAAAALGSLSLAAEASGHKSGHRGHGSAHSQPKHEHVLISFTGTGKGNFNWTVPEDDTGDTAGTCTAPSNNYTVVDNYTFKWSEKLSFPSGAGTYVLPKDYTVGGTDVTTQQQGSCTNGFGSPTGGDSFNCTLEWAPLPSSDTEYPTVELSGTTGRLTAKSRGSIQQGGTPVGSNCVGAPLGRALNSFSFEKMMGQVTFPAAQLEQKGAITRPASGSFTAQCGGVTCDQETCKDDQSSPANVPTTCSDQQSYMGELKVQLLKS